MRFSVILAFIFSAMFASASVLKERSPEPLAASDIEIDIVEGAESLVALGEICDRDDGPRVGVRWGVFGKQADRPVKTTIRGDALI